MSFKSTILRTFFSLRSRSVERFRRRPAETQRKELERLRRECARTEFGRRYGFGEIRTPEAFAQRVERFDYTSFKPYVERMMAGEAAGTGEPGTGKGETAVPVEKAQEGKAADTRPVSYTHLTLPTIA